MNRTTFFTGCTTTSLIVASKRVTGVVGVASVMALILNGGLTINAAHAQPSCPTDSPQTTENPTSLQSYAGANADGVTWNAQSAVLQNRKEGGNFSFTSQTIVGNPYYMCTADFTGDGFPDIATLRSVNSAWLDHTGLILYRNDTKINQTPPFSVLKPPPDWTNPGYVTVPLFTPLDRTGVAGGTAGPIDNTGKPNYGGPWNNIEMEHGSAVLGCGDVNGDNKADIVLIANTYEYYTSQPNYYRADVFLGNGNGTFQPKYNLVTSSQTNNMFKGMWGDGVALIYDENGDGRNDIILASSGETVNKLPSGAYDKNFGVVRSYRNLGGTQPKFAAGQVLIADPLTQRTLSRDNRGFQSVAFGDFNADGIKDIAANGIRDSRVFIHYGLQGGGFAANASLILDAPSGVWNKTGGQSLMVTDFNLDGRDDVVTSTDFYRTSPLQPARYLHWRNAGPPNFFNTTNVTNSEVLAGLAQSNGQIDSDTAFWFDYDQDPDHTPDLCIADGSEAVKVGIFANRVQTTYVQCGDVYSDPIPLGNLANTDIVITGARITPTWTIPTGTSITLFGTNEDPANWQQASLCPGSSTDYCVNFPKPVGRTLRWKTRMCSNAARTVTPTIAGMKLKFTYEKVELHFRAGAVSDTGAVYVGAFRQPGERGDLFGMSTSLNTTYFNLATRLDVPTVTRKLYTTKVDGKSRLDFDTSQSAGAEFISALGVTTSAEATAVVNWWKGFRFGNADHRLGAIVESTPAVLGPPTRPYYYDGLTSDAATRSSIDAFVTQRADRPKLVLVGSKDGALHAINTDPPEIPCLTSAFSGSEAWSFIPQRVANGFSADKNLATASSFVDGAVTLADVKISGAYRTVAVFGLGNGGRSISALDITDTVVNTRSGTCVASQTVSGPVPLWEYASADFGLTRSKPIVARVKQNGAEKFIAVVASGVDPTNAAAPWSKGRDVEALDIETGARVWKFRAKCPVTTDLVASPVLATGGFVTEVMFGDYCGNVYRVPANTVNLSGWVTGAGSLTVATNSDSTPIKAIFHVGGTAGIPAGEDRPIFGTLAVRQRVATDTSVSIYLGTGGFESFDPSKQNAFIEIDSADGLVRGSIQGTCSAGRCDKFYGGIVVTPTQVFLTRARDAVAGTGTCDRGSAQIASVDLNLANVTVVASFTSSIQSAVFGSSDGIYATDLGGEVIRVHAQNIGGTNGGGGGGSTTGAISLKRRNWRQVF